MSSGGGGFLVGDRVIGARTVLKLVNCYLREGYNLEKKKLYVKIHTWGGSSIGQNTYLFFKVCKMAQFIQKCKEIFSIFRGLRLYFSIPGGGGPDPGMYFYIQFFFF